MSIDAKASNTAAGGIGNTRPNYVWFRFLVVLLLIVDFGSFAFSVYDKAYRDTGAVIFAEKKRDLKNIYWGPFFNELELFREKGYPFVDNVNKFYMEFRKFNGVVADYLGQKVLRASAVIYHLSSSFLLLLFIFVEGCVRRQWKIVNFENISSTLYHYALRRGFVGSLGVILLYVFFPAGVNFFGIQFPEKFLGFWLFEPTLWGIIIVISLSFALYYIGSNMPRDI